MGHPVGPYYGTYEAPGEPLVVTKKARCSKFVVSGATWARVITPHQGIA